MSKVVRVNDITCEKLAKYHDILLERYGADCSLVPNVDDFTNLLMAAVCDAISYHELILHDD